MRPPSLLSDFEIIVEVVFGALLVGGGVILVLAHNWAELSRASRAVLSLAPIVLTAAFAGFTLAAFYAQRFPGEIANRSQMNVQVASILSGQLLVDISDANARYRSIGAAVAPARPRVPSF